MHEAERGNGVVISTSSKGNRYIVVQKQHDVVGSSRLRIRIMLTDDGMDLFLTGKKYVQIQ